jgi:hypothetical protein
MLEFYAGPPTRHAGFLIGCLGAIVASMIARPGELALVLQEPIKQIEQLFHRARQLWDPLRSVNSSSVNATERSKKNRKTSRSAAFALQLV